MPGYPGVLRLDQLEGGVNGRKLNLAYNLDDGGNPSQFTQLAHTLIDQDHAFAVVGIATAFFSPSYFVATGTPDLRLRRDRQLDPGPQPLCRRRLLPVLSRAATRPGPT